jgi:protoporphyrinogen IX oxidase
VSYEWVKVLHVLAVISWMAGLLYLPRLMVYHCGSAVGSESDGTFMVMERRLLKAIMNPAMVATLLSGLMLIWLGSWSPGDVWLASKLVGVLLLVGCHFRLHQHVLALARGERNYSARYFRILNEVPTLLMVVIVVCVIVKPFA